MAYKKRKYGARKPKRTFRKKSLRTHSKPARSFAKKVRRVLKNTAETKMISQTGTYTIAPYSGAYPWTDVNLGINASTLLPSQGTGQGSRIGNKITTKKVMLRGYVTPYGYAAISNPKPVPVNARMLLLSNRAQPQNTPTVSTFYQAGNTSVGPNGSLQDLIRPYNRDVNTVYTSRDYKIGHSSESGTGSDAVNGLQANNDYRMNAIFKLDITKYLPKTITFDDTTTTPITRNLFMRWILANADGNPNLASASHAVFWTVDYQYTDV